MNILNERRMLPRERGFTLIEMLVAFAVLGLLTIMIAQIIGLSSKAISRSSRNLDGVSQSRLALDRIGVDLASRPRRADLQLLFVKASGNDSFEFCSEVKGYDGIRNFSVIGYRIQESNTEHFFQLERAAQGTDWTGTTVVNFLPSLLPSISEENYEVLADSIFRLEFCYLKTDGTYSNSSQSDLKDVAALVVAFAGLDSQSRKMVTNENLQALAKALPDCPDGAAPATAWYSALAQSSFGGGTPAQAVQAVRIYQRYFYVP